MRSSILKVGTLGLICATLSGAGIFKIAPATAQIAEGRWLWLSSKSASPVQGASGKTRGQITVASSGGRSFVLTSYSNDTEGWTNTVYQCPELIVRYSSALGFGSGALGNGHEVAKNFASRSGGQFTFQRNGQSSERPFEGAVISISGTDTQGRSFPPPEGQYGHVGIVQTARFDLNAGTVTLFDQNWPSAAWKTIGFERRNGLWYGTMPNNPSGGPSQLVDVAGWANPAPTSRQAASPQTRPTQSTTASSSSQSAAASIPSTPRNTLPGRSSEPGTRLSGSSVTISWSSIRGATEYDLSVRDMTDKKSLPIDRLSRTYHIVRVRPGHTYRWSVKACNAAGCSDATERLYFNMQ